MRHGFREKPRTRHHHKSIRVTTEDIKPYTQRYSEHFINITKFKRMIVEHLGQCAYLQGGYLIGAMNIHFIIAIILYAGGINEDNQTFTIILQNTNSSSIHVVKSASLQCSTTYTHYFCKISLRIVWKV